MNAHEELKQGAAALVRMYLHIHRVSEGRAFADPTLNEFARNFAAEFEAGLIEIKSTRGIAPATPARGGNGASLNGFDSPAVPAAAAADSGVAPPPGSTPSAVVAGSAAEGGPTTAAEFLGKEEI